MGAQQIAFNNYWQLVLNLLQQHITSDMHFTSMFPCALAGIFSTDAGLRATSVKFFSENIAAFNAAKNIATPDIKSLMKKHPFHSTAMKYGIAFFEAGGADGAQFKRWFLLL